MHGTGQVEVVWTLFLSPILPAFCTESQFQNILQAVLIVEPGPIVPPGAPIATGHCEFCIEFFDGNI